MSQVFRRYTQSFSKDTALPVQYDWDDWHYTDYFYFDTADLRLRFESLSDLANRGLVIACAEYIAARFWPYPDPPEAVAFFDAAWVSMIDPEACDYAILTQEDWAGPVRGVLRAAMLVVNDTLFDAREDLDYAARSCWIYNLARYVMPQDHLPRFTEWFDICVARLSPDWNTPLQTGGMFNPEFDLGPPTAPGNFILENAPFKPESARSDLSRHVSSLSPENPWLPEADHT